MISARHGSVAGITVASALLLVAIVGATSTASAAPPSYRYQNREAGRGAFLGSFTETSDGYRFTYFAANQFFDRAGTYEGADFYFYEETADSDSYTYREAGCPVERSALAISKTDATAAALIDTASCYFNFRYSYDYATGEETYGEGFSGMLDVAGTWQDATATESNQSNGRMTSPWDTFGYNCSYRAGSLHTQAEVLVNNETWGSGGSSGVYSNDCNVLSKGK